MSPLAEDSRRRLLNIARQSIISAVRSELPAVSPGDPALTSLAGAFVTLRLAGRLRGCMGRLDFSQPLGDVVACCAVSAAFHDSRFRPATAEEIPALTIEISVLSPPLSIRPEEIEIGRHGLIISRGPARGVLLPQVALEHSWDALYFLGETCVKAGLAREGWRNPRTSLEGFTAEVFSEADFADSASSEHTAGYSNSA